MRPRVKDLATPVVALLAAGLAGCGVETTTKIPPPAPPATSPAARPGERSVPDVPGNVTPRDGGPREQAPPPSPHVPG